MSKLNIAMIMDGNRRFARKRGLPSVKGHEYGAKKLEEILKWAKGKDIASLTLYTFSTENFNRAKEEVDYIFKLFEEYFSKILNDINNKELSGLRIKFLGRLHLFPENIQKICKEIEEKTKDREEYLLQFCFGYGGRAELVDAVKELIKQGAKEEEVTEELIQDYLYSSIEPDIVIRTSGEIRLSNFLMWQSAYSEWFFLEETWPELTTEKIAKVIEDFHKRNRRRGK